MKPSRAPLWLFAGRPERKALIRNYVSGIEVVGDEATLTYAVPMPLDGVTGKGRLLWTPVQPGQPDGNGLLPSFVTDS